MKLFLFSLVMALFAPAVGFTQGEFNIGISLASAPRLDVRFAKLSEQVRQPFLLEERDVDRQLVMASQPAVVEKSSIPVAPLGGVYTLSVKLPVVGRHEFYLKVVNEDHVHLKVTGKINIDELVPFQIVDTDGNAAFQLSGAAIKTLRWPYFIQVKSVQLKEASDQVAVVISAAVFKTWWLDLERVHS